MKTWRDIAIRTISEALAEAKAHELDNTAALKLVDSRYPFGERKMHPYKIWLQVRKKMLTGTLIPAKPTPEYIKNHWVKYAQPTLLEVL